MGGRRPGEPEEPPAPRTRSSSSPPPLPPTKRPSSLPPPARSAEELRLPPPARPTIALAVSGSIASYKAAAVARLLVQRGVRVLPVMTRAAERFLGAATLSGICGERVRSDMFDPDVAGELHVDLGRAADLVLIAPATADLLARVAQGRASDLVTALVLCARGPVLAAPAMHPTMWSHPSVQRNVAALAADRRVELVGPVDGEVASGERGIGRMADPEEIVAAALARIGPADLQGLRVVVTAGPTVEDLDPVRFLGNRSTGKMGFAVAERAAARGATVTLITGPVSLQTPRGVKRIDVRGALSMRDALWQALTGTAAAPPTDGQGVELTGADALVMTAAVADYRPAEEHGTKIKRASAPTTLTLLPNPDLLAEVGAARTGRAPVLVGFAVETDSDDRVIAAALNKLENKRIDLVVANHASDSFGRDDNRATLVSRSGAESLGVLAKTLVADRILDRVGGMCRHGPLVPAGAPVHRER